MYPDFDLILPIQPGSTCNSYCWQGDVFRFRPATAARQLKIVHTISGDPDISNLENTIGIDDAQDFLGYYTAGLALKSKGFDTVAQEKFVTACGDPSGECVPGSLGGFLLQITRPGVKSLQHERIILRPFRNKRNTGFFNRF